MRERPLIAFLNLQSASKILKAQIGVIRKLKVLSPCSQMFFSIAGYCQQFFLSSSKTVKSTFNLLKKKKAPPWTKSCGRKTKDPKSVTLISNLLDYPVLQMNSCEFE